MVYNKTALAETSARSLPLYSKMAGYPAENNFLVPRQVVTHMQNIGNNWVVEFWLLRNCNEDSESVMFMNSSSLLSRMYLMAASIANISAVQIEASSLIRQLNSWSSQTKDIAVLLSSFDPSVYTFRCLENLQNSSSNMLWKTRGQVSTFLRSERLKSILGCWRSQGGHSGGRTTLIASRSTSMSSRWGLSLIPKVGIVPGLLLNKLLYSGLTTHEYDGFSGFAFIFI